MKNFASGTPLDDFQASLIEVKERFQIPLWPWQRLAQAMIFDLHHDSFKSFLVFLRYTEGAAIAPASIFMHLCGVNESNGTYTSPLFEIRTAARRLAIFSYLVHIIRDIQKDQQSNLNYFALDMLARHDLTPAIIRKAVETSIIPDKVRLLIKEYVLIAGYYRSKAREQVDRTLPLLKPQYQISLELIYALYNQIYERIDWEQGVFTVEELLPTPEEVKLRIQKKITAFTPKS